jgi:hypothetical protein
MKSFSVVLTYFKRPELLARALYCLRQQTYANFEVVPIFDQEPDKQAEFCYEQFRAMVGDTMELRDIVLLPGNRRDHGNGARHEAMNYCHKDYVLWYGHDCLIDKDFLQTHADQIADDWCISVVSQAHFSPYFHQDGWLTLKGDLPLSDDLRMGELDLLNFALPLHEAREYAWVPRLRERYEADWFTFRDVRNATGLDVRISPKTVCAHF